MKTILEVVQACVSKHRDDTQKAKSEAVRLTQSLDEAATIAEMLFRNYIHNLVDTERHQQNCEIKRSTGQYHCRAKGKYSTSPSVNKTMLTMYDMCILGTRLGSMNREKLLEAGNQEASIARGHSYNSLLATRLADMVGTKTVEESVKLNRLNRLSLDIRKELGISQEEEAAA